jgi:hypothetical protein
MTEISGSRSIGPDIPDLEGTIGAGGAAAPPPEPAAAPPAASFADRLVTGGDAPPTAESLLGVKPSEAPPPDAAPPEPGSMEAGLAEFQDLLAQSFSLEKEALDAELATARLIGGPLPSALTAPTVRQSEELIDKMHTQAESFLTKAFTLADDLLRRADGEAASLESAGLVQAEEILKGFHEEIQQLRGQAELELAGQENADADSFWSQFELQVTSLRFDAEARADETRSAALQDARKLRDSAFGQAFQIRQSAIDRADSLHRTAFRQSHDVRSSRLENEESRADQLQEQKLDERAEALRQAELDVTRRLDGLRQALNAEIQSRQAKI